MRSKNHLENEQQNEIIIPDWLFQEPVENKTNERYNPKSLKLIARNNIRLDHKHFKKELAKKIPNPFYFTDISLKMGFKISLDSHPINHANSKLTVIPNYPEFGNETRHTNKIMKKIYVIYARLIYQYTFKYQTVFSARFDKQAEDNQVLDETELFINLNINKNLTESDLDKIDIKSPLEHQKQQQEMKNSGWKFDKINSMTICFYKTGELNGSKYVKIPLISNAFLSIENIDK